MGKGNPRKAVEYPTDDHCNKVITQSKWAIHFEIHLKAKPGPAPFIQCDSCKNH